MTFTEAIHIDVLSQTKKGIGQQMRDASFSLAHATYAAGGKFKQRLQNKVQQARIRVRVSQVCSGACGRLLPVHFSTL